MPLHYGRFSLPRNPHRQNGDRLSDCRSVPRQFSWRFALNRIRVEFRQTGSLPSLPSIDREINHPHHKEPAMKAKFKSHRLVYLSCAAGILAGWLIGSGTSLAQYTHQNHICRNISCDDIMTNVGGLCGWCTSSTDPEQVMFDKCMPNGPGCNESTVQTYTCKNGRCTNNALASCNHTYGLCATTEPGGS